MTMHTVTQIYLWRAGGEGGKGGKKIAVPTITARLTADPATYPSPDGKPWSEQTVYNILRNPKYTGHMVYGRTTKKNGKIIKLPPDQWNWSDKPTHPALIDRATWDAAQQAGAEHGNIRDPEIPGTRPGRTYTLRARIRHRACQHRMSGYTRSYDRNGKHSEYTYYRCPVNPYNARHAAANPGHLSISVSETRFTTAIHQFLAERIFGPDRAAMLAAQIPATAAERAAKQRQRAEHLRKELARIDSAQAGLMTELEELGADKNPAAKAYRARNAELHQDHTTTQTQLAELHATTPDNDDDPALLDELPLLPDLISQAPAHLLERLYDAFDIQILYRDDKQQATIWATITDATPQTIHNLTTDPRTDHDTHPTTPTQNFSHLAPAPITPAVGHRWRCRRCPLGKSWAICGFCG